MGEAEICSFKFKSKFIVRATFLVLKFRASAFAGCSFVLLVLACDLIHVWARDTPKGRRLTRHGHTPGGIGEQGC